VPRAPEAGWVEQGEAEEVPNPLDALRPVVEVKVELADPVGDFKVIRDVTFDVVCGETALESAMHV
jgi:hypothetical protein